MMRVCELTLIGSRAFGAAAGGRGRRIVIRAIALAI